MRIGERYGASYLEPPLIQSIHIGLISVVPTNSRGDDGVVRSQRSSSRPNIVFAGATGR